MARDTPVQVLAAGAVLWRPEPDGTHRPEVAVIHRPRYDDWSLPKGKVDPGETEAVTAVREIFEETGFHAQLGRRLMSVGYPVEQSVKKVVYWAARAGEGDFTPNHEVDKLLWLPADDVMNTLTYAHDRKVLRRFTRQPADTRTVLIVRHGTAGRKSRYKGDDRNRPLGQTRPGAGRIPDRSAAGVRGERPARRQIAFAATRRSSHWPKSFR